MCDIDSAVDDRNDLSTDDQMTDVSEGSGLSRASAYWWGVAVADYDEALALLIGEGYQTVSNDIVLLRTEDKPGVLAEVSRKITDNGIGIRSLTLMQVNSEGVVCAVATTDNPKVREIFDDQVVN